MEGTRGIKLVGGGGVKETAGTRKVDVKGIGRLGVDVEGMRRLRVDIEGMRRLGVDVEVSAA